MGETDWYRRESWTASDREAFFSRLESARGHNKAQALRIQAWHLEQTGGPALLEGALELLDHLIERYPSQVHLASAHRQRATCLAAQGRSGEAIEAYRDAMQAQRQYPGVRSNAALGFGMFAVRHRRTELYNEVVAALEEFIGNLRFPVEQYQFNAVYAIIMGHRGDPRAARKYARRALAAYAMKDSGLRYHPEVGLVTEPDGELLDRLEALCGG